VAQAPEDDSQETGVFLGDFSRGLTEGELPEVLREFDGLGGGEEVGREKACYVTGGSFTDGGGRMVMMVVVAAMSGGGVDRRDMFVRFFLFRLVLVLVLVFIFIVILTSLVVILLLLLLLSVLSIAAFLLLFLLPLPLFHFHPPSISLLRRPFKVLQLVVRHFIIVLHHHLLPSLPPSLPPFLVFLLAWLQVTMLSYNLQRCFVQALDERLLVFAVEDLLWFVEGG